MTEDVKVSVELDKLKAERSLRDLAKELNTADSLIKQMKKSGIIWASEFESAAKKVRKELVNVGKATTAMTNEGVKGNKKYANSLFNLVGKFKSLNNQIQSANKNFAVLQNATKTPATSVLRDDNEARRQKYFAKVQQQYVKQQEQIRKLNKQQTNDELAELRYREKNITASFKRIAAQRESYKLKSIKQLSLDTPNISGNRALASLGGQKANNDLLRHNAALNKKAAQEARKKAIADKELARGQLSLAESGKRLSYVALSQAGNANKLSYAWRLVKQEWRESTSIANVAQTATRGLTATLGSMLYSVVNLAKTSPSLASDMLGYRNALALASGSQEEATKLLNTAIGIADSLKISIISVTKEYSKFTNAATIAGLSVQQATDTFEDFAVAARVLNLDPQRTSGMFLALEQMVSKGTVSLEELRRQLGEHIPGAVPLAAQAMDYAADEVKDFIKEVTKGNVSSTELVQKLGKLLRLRTEPQLASSLQKFSAALTDLQNSATKLGIKLGDIASQFLVPFLTKLAGGVDIIASWFPATSLLGESNEVLATSLSKVNTAADAVTSTLESTSGLFDRVANSSLYAAEGIDTVKKATQEFSLIGIGMTAILGAAGMGGAFALLAKTSGLFVAGLRNFVSPLKKIAGGLAGIIGLKAGWKKLVGVVETFLGLIVSLGTRLALFAVLNPFGFLAASAAAATAAVGALAYSMTDSIDPVGDAADEAKDKIKELKTEFKSLADMSEGLRDTAWTYGADAIGDQLDAAKKAYDQNQLHLKNVEAHIALLESKKTWWDSIAGSAGHVTDNVRSLETQIKNAKETAELLKKPIDDSGESLKEATANGIKLVDTLELAKKAAKDFAATEELRGVQLDISLMKSGVDGVKADIAKINQETQNSLNELAVKNDVKPDQQEIDRIIALRDAKVEQALLRDEINKSKKASQEYANTLKSNVTAIDSYKKSVQDSILSQSQQNQLIGKTVEETARLNLAFQRAADLAKYKEMAEKATTSALKQRVAVIYEQLTALHELRKANLLLQEQDRAHQAELDRKEKATEDLLSIQEKGYDLLKSTLPLEQQYAEMMTNDIIPALKAVGATQEQIDKVSQQQWAQLVDSSKNGLKSMQAVSEEVAKAMHNTFEDFFFNAMEGNITNMEQSFNAALRRMIANEMASKLSQQMMQGFGGNSFFNTILTGLGATSAAPALGSTMAMGGGYVTIPGVQMHTGGLGTEAMPRYHSGIGPREEAAVIRKDEGVFTPGQMSSMASLGTVQKAVSNSNVYSPSISIVVKGDGQDTAEKIGRAVKMQLDSDYKKRNNMRLNESQTSNRLSTMSKKSARNA
jgi:tape measure domain-containing protein